MIGNYQSDDATWDKEKYCIIIIIIGSYFDIGDRLCALPYNLPNPIENRPIDQMRRPIKWMLNKNLG